MMLENILKILIIFGENLNKLKLRKFSLKSFKQKSRKKIDK
jgi:hypothetical protein